MRTYNLANGNKVTVKTGCIGKRTLIQSCALSLILGTAYLLYHLLLCKGTGLDDYIWPYIAFFLAPFVVDAIRPVHIYHQ